MAYMGKLTDLRDNEVTVVERGSLNLYHDVVLAHLGQLRLAELEAIEALLGAGDGPLLHSRWRHCVELKRFRLNEFS